MEISQNEKITCLTVLWPRNNPDNLKLKSRSPTLYTSILIPPPLAQILARFAPWPAVFETQGYQNLEDWKCTEWPQNDLEYVTTSKVRLYSKFLPPRSKIWSISLCDQPKYNCLKSEMHQMTLEWPWTLNGPFCSMVSYFRDATRLPKSENEHRMTSEGHWTLNGQSIPCTLSIYPSGTNFSLFCSTVRLFRDTAHFIIPPVQSC